MGLGLFGTGLDLGPLLAGLPFLALTTAAFSSLGILGAAFIVVAKRGNPFTGPINQLTLLLSGALYPVSVLPDWLEPVTRLVPAFYGIRALRGMVLGGDGFTDHLGDLALLAVFAATLLPASMLVLRRALDTARAAGTLGSY
ncbi:MAG: ABC transporter permease [Actinomyces sp.]|nr:MAG: ABC transporter permease [Actinomyces sp.]